MKITYEGWNPSAASQALVTQAERICDEYARQGFVLTLRQLYYQFVARDLLPNSQRSYKNLGNVVAKARMAGMLDWNHVEDRTRNLASLGHWNSPAEIIDSAAEGYHIDLWEGQPTRVEVWVEKEALAGVIERAASEWDVSWFSCRGYVSQSELWRAAMRHKRYERDGTKVTVLHLGDHDPSGIDMTRDIQDRLAGFGARTWVDRIALNMDQVEQYDPPPNPAKFTDSRIDSYVAEYGDESWELDALEPAMLVELIEEHIRQIVDLDLYQARQSRKDGEQSTLRAIAGHYDEIADQYGA